MIAFMTTIRLLISQYSRASQSHGKRPGDSSTRSRANRRQQTKEPGKLVVTTNKDYDLGEMSKLMRGVYMGVAMMAFLHGYMKYVIFACEFVSL